MKAEYEKESHLIIEKIQKNSHLLSRRSIPCVMFKVKWYCMPAPKPCSKVVGGVGYIKEFCDLFFPLLPKVDERSIYLGNGNEKENW